MATQTIQYRTATRADVSGIREVARGSIAASYGHALSDALIDEAVETWYAAEELTDELGEESAEFVVASAGETVVGFAQCYYVERREAVGEIDWLHVHPDHRGAGIGEQLLGRIETRLRSRGVERIEGRVLAANESGGEFYEQQGFSMAGERDVEIGDGRFTERIYSKFISDGQQVLTEARTTADGDRVYVAYDESERASDAPLYTTYADRDRAQRVGFLCGACGELADTMDSMGRVECSCGNRRKATRWDAAYL
jgi:Acetyltransferases